MACGMFSPTHSVRQRAEWFDLPRHTGRRTCVLGGHEGMTGSLRSTEVHFTESLILAQDERWRRA
jgi:hypothetical protein